VDSTDAWDALAELLRRQRVVVLGVKSRAQFARDLGINDRILSDLENGTRGNYELDTLLSLESWYRLTPDQLRAVLGDLYPLRTVTTQHPVATITSAAGSDADIEHLEQSIAEIRHMLDVMSDQLDEYHRKR